MKLLISEAQLEALIMHIDESSKPKQVIEEGWKEVVLGTAMLMGIGLTGVNAQTAEKALEDSDILSKIENTLEGPEIEKLANTLEKGGLSNAMDKIIANAEQIKTNFEVAAKKKGINPEVKIYNTSDVEKVRGKVKQDYAVSDIEITKDTIWTPQDTVILDSLVEITFKGNVFETGTFDLNSDIISELEYSIKKILMTNGKINSIKIESSTDTEPIKMGNEKLAQIRGNKVKEYLSSIGVSDNVIIKTLPEQGPNVFSKTMTSQEREQARKEVSKYRYVKVILDATFERVPEDNERAFDVIENIEYELVKIKSDSKSHKKTHKPPIFKTFKLKKCKVNGDRTSCPKF